MSFHDWPFEAKTIPEPIKMHKITITENILNLNFINESPIFNLPV